MNLKNYYLDIDKINREYKEQKEERNKIHDYYKDMLYCYSDGRKDVAEGFFNTLLNAGFLKNVRDEKIDQILS